MTSTEIPWTRDPQHYQSQIRFWPKLILSYEEFLGKSCVSLCRYPCKPTRQTHMWSASRWFEIHFLGSLLQATVCGFFLVLNFRQNPPDLSVRSLQGKSDSLRHTSHNSPQGPQLSSGWPPTQYSFRVFIGGLVFMGRFLMASVPSIKEDRLEFPTLHAVVDLVCIGMSEWPFNSSWISERLASSFGPTALVVC